MVEHIDDYMLDKHEPLEPNTWKAGEAVNHGSGAYNEREPYEIPLGQAW